jgi:hypothetical protein
LEEWLKYKKESAVGASKFNQGRNFIFFSYRGLACADVLNLLSLLKLIRKLVHAHFLVKVGEN